jgi:hypothetical protein
MERRGDLKGLQTSIRLGVYMGIIYSPRDGYNPVRRNKIGRFMISLPHTPTDPFRLFLMRSE